MAVAVRLVLVCLFTGILPAFAMAQVLKDPTKPPPEFLPRTASARTDVAAAGMIVIISSSRKQVTLGADTARLGGNLGGRTLIGVSDSELVFRNGSEVERLALYDGVRKQAVGAGLAVVQNVPAAP